MNIHNLQWQGSGLGNELKKGSEIIRKYFEGIDFHILNTVENGLETKHNIIAYDALKQQMQLLKKAIETENPTHITSIGGDCSGDALQIAYLNNFYENFGIVWIDAHADIHTPESSPSKNFHGMPLRLLLGEGEKSLYNLLFSKIKHPQIHYIGLRSVDPEEQVYIDKHNIFTSKKPNFEFLKETLQAKKIKNLYIHLDVDVIDPSIFPHIKCPVQNGLKVKELENFIGNLHHNYNVVGQSITEMAVSSMRQLKVIEPILQRIQKKIQK